MSDLLPFQFDCGSQPEWLTEIADQIDDDSTNIKLKDFISKTDITDPETLRNMIIFKDTDTFSYYKSEYKWYTIYYYKWSSIEFYYFDEGLTEIMEE